MKKPTKRKKRKVKTLICFKCKKRFSSKAGIYRRNEGILIAYNFYCKKCNEELDRSKKLDLYHGCAYCESPLDLNKDTKMLFIADLWILLICNTCSRDPEIQQKLKVKISKLIKQLKEGKKENKNVGNRS